MILVYVGILFGALIAAYNWLSRRQEDDAEALEWTTRKEPLVFISEHAFDRDVVARHAFAVAKLKEHGNQYLTDQDVWLYVYRVHMNILHNVHAIERNHSVWQDAAMREAAHRKAEWLKTKYAYNPDAATKIFASQN